MEKLPDREEGLCLSEAKIYDYAYGLLEPVEAEFMQSHLSECSLCCQSLSRIEEKQEDSLLLLLRKAAGGRSSQHSLRELGPSTVDEMLDARITNFSHSDEDYDEFLGTTICQEESQDPAKQRANPTGNGYLIVARINRGGMGVVFRAKQPMLNRTVALKMMLPGRSETHLLRRFEVEGEAVARLQHRYIIQIFEKGIYRGKPFFSMEYMGGGSLEQRLKREKLGQRDAALLLIKLSEGVEYAHSKGVLHRDLKPSNILFTTDGDPKVSDFGLAKILNSPSDCTITQTGAVLGTPSYMAPEQARGSSTIDHRTDVYGLGAILYRILAERTLFRGENNLATLELVRETAPIPPSSYRKELCPRLEAICLKCLAKNPEERFPTAFHLAEALKSWLAESEGTQRRWVSRQRVSAIIAITISLLLFGLITLVQALSSQGVSMPSVDSTRLNPVEEFESRLAKGEVVTLVGSSSLPRWHQFVGDRVDVDLRKNRADNTACFQTSATSGLLLLPKVPFDRYVFSVEIRHDQSGARDCCAGILVCHSDCPTALGKAHLMCVLEYDELRNEQDGHAHLMKFFKERQQNNPKARIPPKPEGNAVRLYSHLIMVSGKKLNLDPKHETNRQYFVPNPAKPGPWRKLELEVSPTAILGRWEGREKRINMNVEVMNARLPEWFNAIETNATLGKKAIGELEPTIPLRGGLGIYARNATLSFRNATIQRRLPEE